MAIETKEKLDLKTNLTQRFEIPLDLENGRFTAYGTYELYKNTQRGSGKRLEIGIPEFSIDNGRRGLYATFEDYDDINMHSASVKGGREYWHNPKLKRVFEKSIKPILEKSLPAYMNKLIRFDE